MGSPSRAAGKGEEAGYPWRPAPSSAVTLVTTSWRRRRPLPGRTS